LTQQLHTPFRIDKISRNKRK